MWLEARSNHKCTIQGIWKKENDRNLFRRTFYVFASFLSVFEKKTTHSNHTKYVQTIHKLSFYVWKVCDIQKKYLSLSHSPFSLSLASAAHNEQEGFLEKLKKMEIRSMMMVSYPRIFLLFVFLTTNVSSLRLRSASVVGPAWNLPRPSWSTNVRSSRSRSILANRRALRYAFAHIIWIRQVLSTKPLPVPVDPSQKSSTSKTTTGSESSLAQQTFLRNTAPGLTPLARQYADLSANQQNSNMYNPNLLVPIPDQTEPRMAQSVYAFSPSSSTPSLEAAMRYAVDTHPALVDSMQGEGEIYSVAS